MWALYILSMQRIRDGLRRIAKPAKILSAGVTQIACGYYLFTEYIGGIRFVQGGSMLPTMSAQTEAVIEETFSAHRSPPRIKRGDLVTFRAIYDPTKDVCKRVIGLPGDTICVNPDRALIVEGRRSPKSDQQKERWEVEHVVVPRGHVWVTGDNMSNSRDSREFGPIPIGVVRGRLIARIYPHPRWFGDSIVYID